MSTNEDVRVKAAADMLSAQEPLPKKTALPKLMALCGFSEEESTNRNLQQKIRRLSKKKGSNLLVGSSISINTTPTTISTLSTASNTAQSTASFSDSDDAPSRKPPPIPPPNALTKEPPVSPVTLEKSFVQHCSPATQEFNSTKASVDRSSLTRKRKKTTYKTSKQKLTYDGNQRMLDEATKLATKEAQRRVFVNQQAPEGDKVTVVSILQDVNKKYSTSVTRQTFTKQIVICSWSIRRLFFSLA